MKRKNVTRLLAGLMTAAVIFTGMPVNLTVQAADKAALDIGYPTFKNTELLDEVYDLDALGVSYGEKDIMMKIYEQDLANGGDSFYMDRVLAREGVANGDANSNGNNDGNTFLTRGRALYMYTSNPRIIGFGGSTAYHQPLTGNMYSITFQSGGSTLSTKEDTSKRVNYPSNWVSTYAVGSSLTADVTKFISEQNVAVTAITLNNTSLADQTVIVNAASNFVKAPGEVEVNGEMEAELTGSVTSPAGLTEITTRLTGDGFACAEDNSALVKEVTVPAGGSVDLKVVMAFTTEEIPESTTDYVRFAGLSNLEAIRAQKAEYNLYWAENLPYIDVPKKGVQKAIDYRWWSERFNSLDANIPGYDYQYPVTIEGVLGYNNAIILTQPMHLQDTKWLRTAYLPYGQLFSAGNSSQSSAFLDNPGNRNNWNNHYGQYLAEAGMEAFNVIGGGAEVAENLAYYFGHDATGQLEHYGNHIKGHNLIAYRNNYMTGNDADTISMHAPGVGAWKAHGENAYVWAAADAAAKMYEQLGNDTLAKEYRELADKIQSDILELLWCEECEKFETYAVSPTSAQHNADQPNLVKYTESNNYNYFAVGAVPTDEASIAKYKKALKTFSNGEEFPIFPYYTANQVDNKTVSGSNNFSNINFTVQARAYEAALRTYDKEQEYITDEMLAMMTEWMAWNVFPDSGDVRYPNNNEFYNIDNRTMDTYYRSWIYHNVLGNYNYIFFEDMAGIQPRSDEKIELSPIDFSYDHFMINNARYHGHDLTVVWDKPDDGKTYYDGLPEGYSLYVDGKLAFTLADLAHVIYDNGKLEFPDGEVEVTANGSAASIPSAINTPITNEKVAAMLEKSGIHGMTNLAEGAAVEASYTPSEARAASWAEKHRADGSDNTSKAVNEMVPDPAAVTDGTTVNMPFWGNYGSVNVKDSLVLNLGSEKTVDMAALYFYNDRQNSGYSEPAKYTVEYLNADGEWQHVQKQSREPAEPKANYNTVLFEAVTTSQMRFTFTNKDDNYTAVTEIQLFEEGGERVDVSENAAPQVTLSEDTAKTGSLRTAVTAKIVDDGKPYDADTTYKWEVIEKPENADVILSTSNKPSTVVSASEAGDYTLRFTVNDGELETSADITVTIKAAAATGLGDDVAPKAASVESDYTSSWENLNGINNEAFEPTSSNIGTGKGWGNWSQAVGSEHYVGYTWNSPVTIGGSEVYWYDDGGGTQIPGSFRMEYMDANGDWQDVNILTPYDSAIAKNKYNTIYFEPVTTTRLRLYVTVKSGAAANGIYRFKVYTSVEIDKLDEVHIATKPGVMPTLPESVPAWSTSGTLISVPVEWETLTEDMIQKDGTVELKGINTATGKMTKATVYVRTDLDSATITSVEPVEVTTQAGKVPNLPQTVKVGYNDGAYDNQNVKVTWPKITSDMLSKAGDVTFEGEVEGTTTKALLTIHVIQVDVDKTTLKETIAAAEELNEKDYTAASFAPIKAALDAAKVVYENADATETQVADAVKALNEAMAAKVGIKDVLNQEIAKAEALKEEAYTPESYAAFKTALDAAKAVQNTEDVTEDVVNEAVKNLLAAKEKLVKTGEVHCILDLKFEKPEDLTVVKDSSENAFDSEATGIEEADYIEGVSGTGLQFNGKTLYNIPAGANLATPSITLSYWIKRTGKMEGDSPILWAKKGWNEDGFYTNYPAGDSYSSFFVVDGFNGFYVKENPNEFLPENEWTHIAVTWDADSKTGKIYKNGVEQEIVFEGTPESITGSDNATNTMGDNGYQNSPTANLALDEFRIYDSAVNAEAVKALYDEFMNAPEADKKELQALFDSCQSIDKNLYTEESIAKMEEAMNAAYDVLADENATQSEVDNAKAALQKAISELALIEEPKVDKSALQAMFDEYQGVDSTLYTEESMEVFVEAMNKAAEVLFNEEATQEEVDGMVEEFRAAYEGLKLKEEEVIKAALQALYDEAQEIDTEAYTAESVTALTEAMQRAEEVLADEEATQEEVDAVTNDLQSAINGLIKIPDITPVDKGGLEKVIAEAKEKKQEDYTGESWAVFVNALQKAEDVYKNAAAKQEEVDAQKAALQEAMDALVKAGEPKADTTELVAALEKAKGLNKPDYTAKSWAVLEKAVADGNSILQNPKAKQKDVDAAVEAIHAAINGLVKATESPANPNPAKSDKPGNTNNQSTGNKVATGDTAPIFALVMSIICAMAAAVVAIVLIRRNRRIGRR